MRPCPYVMYRSCRGISAPNPSTCSGTGLIPSTSAPGLGSALPHLLQDWAHRAHICAGTELTPATSAVLRRDWAHSAHLRRGRPPAEGATSPGADVGGGEPSPGADVRGCTLAKVGPSDTPSRAWARRRRRASTESSPRASAARRRALKAPPPLGTCRTVVLGGSPIRPPRAHVLQGGGRGRGGWEP
jgi:hypothetical protein